MTWLELFAIYTAHGGAEKENAEAERDPLGKPKMMQTRMADFKKAVRKIKNYAVEVTK